MLEYSTIFTAVTAITVCLASAVFWYFKIRNPFAHLTENELFSRLRLACIDDEPEVARKILSLRRISNINRFTAQSTLLCITSRNGSSEMFRILLDHGADKNGKTQKGDTPLICAARNGHIECLEHLLELGVPVNDRGHRGWTALHWASLNGRYEIAATLVAYGAEIDALTDDGSSCIYLACLSGHGNLVEDMVKYGANVFTIDHKGDTPLHAAARQNGSALKPLLSSNAAYRRNFAGESPIDAALVRGHRKFIDQLLLRRPELKTTFYFDAIDLACTHCRDTKAFENIFKVLSELATLDLSHFEATIKHLVDKIGIVSNSVLQNMKMASGIPVCTSPSPSPSSSQLIELPTASEMESAKADSSTTTSRQPAETTFEESSATGPVDSETVAKSAKFDAPKPEPAIFIFKHLANALANFTHEVTRTPKIARLIERSNLRKQIQDMMVPLAEVWGNLESHIHTVMDNVEAEGRTEESKRQALLQLADVPLIIDRFYNLNRMIVSNPEDWFLTRPSPSDESKDEHSFVQFIDRIYDALRMMIDANSDLLTNYLHFILDMPTTVVMDASRSRTFGDLVEKLSFEQKRNWLRIKIESEQSSAKTGSKIESDRFSRGSLLEVARFVNSELPENLRGKLFVKFAGEAGVGAGVQREWFQFIFQELMDERNGLFVTGEDRVSFAPISNALHAQTDSSTSQTWTKEQRNILFQFTGRLLAMAIVHEEGLSLNFTLPLYKALLNRPSSIEDMKSIDATVYKSLQWLLDNEGVEDLGINFEVVPKNSTQPTDLVPGGSSIPVTESNKQHYVECLTKYYVEQESSEAMAWICTGFFDIVPRRYISPLKETELQELLAGVTNIDLVDWKANTEYSGELTVDSRSVAWFWSWMDKQTPDMHRNVLQFVTGSTTVPLGGFKQLRGVDTRVKFNLTPAPKDNGALPTASTCFNMLKIPLYDTQEQFEARMELAVSEGRLGFSFS